MQIESSVLPANKRQINQIGYQSLVIVLAVILFIVEISKFANPRVFQSMNMADWIWAVLAGSQILVTKAMRVPLAPGKWIDFTYVPIWIVAFTLPGPVSMLMLVVFSGLIYFIYPQQFTCRRTAWVYVFHLSYQVILFYATIGGFWLVENHMNLQIGGLPLTGTIAMFASMFGLMFADTLLGGTIQILEGQRNVWKEWALDYLRITIVQTLLSSLAMMFAVLFATGHPIQLIVVYAFFLMAVVILYRMSLRQDDFIGVMQSMEELVELKDTYTKNHSESVGYYSMVLGQKLGFPSSRMQRLNIAAKLHDVGKIGIPDHVLKKQGPLTDEEFALMKEHAAFGEQVLRPLKSLKQEAYIIGRHHERMDGRGYPYMAKAEEIPLESRIITVADSYHAMISHRPYRRGCSTEEAVRRLEEGKGTHFDPELVDLFAEYVQNPGRHTYRFRPFCLVH